MNSNSHQPPSPGPKDGHTSAATRTSYAQDSPLLVGTPFARQSPASTDNKHVTAATGNAPALPFPDVMSAVTAVSDTAAFAAAGGEGSGSRNGSLLAVGIHADRTAH